MGITFRGGWYLWGAPGSQYHSAPNLRAASLCANLSSHLLKTGAFFSIVAQSPSHVRLFATPWTAACQASLSFTVSQSLPKFMSTESVMPSDHLILCLPFSSCPQPFPASESFPMSWLFASSGQSIGAAASASVLPVNIQGSFPLGLSGLIYSFSNFQIYYIPMNFSYCYSKIH